VKRARVLFGALVVVDVLALLTIGQRVHAQELDPHAGEQVYLTADPINPDRLGLATPDGRYAVRPMQGCDELADGDNITVFLNWTLPPWLAAAPLDWDGNGDPPCLFHLEGRMDPTPCYTNADGLCDVAAEDYDP
jgi:hypothetical protein